MTLEEAQEQLKDATTCECGAMLKERLYEQREAGINPPLYLTSYQKVCYNRKDHKIYPYIATPVISLTPSESKTYYRVRLKLQRILRTQGRL